MKRKPIVLLLMAFCFLLCGCTAGKDHRPTAAEPAARAQLSQAWESILGGVSAEKLTQLGWYADDLRQEALELNSITFSNYDPTRAGAFLEVPFQCSITYAARDPLRPGSTEPVYAVFLSDNASDRYYACEHDSSLRLVTEEGEWFLNEEKEMYLKNMLENCRELLFGGKGGL